ncbi:MAG TPA: hypothetical protein VG454_16450 [Gemmatimonadales bacterium]|nr:hypothetical protein [Gemmatimonadales bacterium]
MDRSLIFLTAALGIAGCMPAPAYTSASVVYAEPARYVYVVPVDRVVVVTQEVLVNRGWTVYRVERSGPNRIIWARQGDDHVVRIFATPERDRVIVRGLMEERTHENRGRHEGWAKRGEPHEIITDIDVKLKERG